MDQSSYYYREFNLPTIHNRKLTFAKFSYHRSNKNILFLAFDIPIGKSCYKIQC